MSSVSSLALILDTNVILYCPEILEVDWVHSHANSGPVANIDVIYTADTPEQEAMVAYAETSGELSYGR